MSFRTACRYYDVQCKQGSLDEDGEWDRDVLSWFHVDDGASTGADGTRLAYSLNMADRTAVPFARVDRVDLASGTY